MKLTALKIVFLLITIAPTPAFAGNSSINDFPWGVLIFIVILGFFIHNSIKSQRVATAKAIKEKEIKAEFAVKAKKRITEIITKHLSTLAIKSQQTCMQDDYGNWDVEGWIKEVEYFIDNVLWKDSIANGYLRGTDSLDNELLAIHTKLLAMEKAKAPRKEIIKLAAKGVAINQKREDRHSETKKLIIDLVSKYCINEAENSPTSAIDVDSLDPVQFEHYCAEILRNSGWDARVTQASGDQGIDVIANLGEVKAVLQCKKYSSPVGNAAVQEIIAGKAFEQAHAAAVVSNATFTPSAKQLASTTGVLLLHYSELPQFAERLGI